MDIRAYPYISVHLWPAQFTTRFGLRTMTRALHASWPTDMFYTLSYYLSFFFYVV
ncbi:hypothetical protein BD626DRAFT_165928 [Schizophyllum amplum]|uniref:Uncharacterized protein n=1 Tax=Schizophyllum amplum TaxID=97359 RepID=A0A550CQ06_9AGAR|nr:hypothetical protein BD626DRAFT_165928 [Auriculariopsis ampla]